MSNPTNTRELDPRVAEAFTSASLTALRELLNEEAFLDTYDSTTDLEPIVSASIQLQQTVPGIMSLRVPGETAERIAQRYLPEGTELSSDLVDDVVGEFANVIAGQAKSILKGTPYHFTISPPTVKRGKSSAEESANRSSAPPLAFVCELGRIVLQVELGSSESPS